ncbi:MAG TPA: HAD-IA family hydrolase [Dehalococcoidia bacterium]|nr:HAD-IA family hydrolase [Dehalococcoidia bacterium]
MALKAIVFDWDLTLWNSWDIHVWLLHQTADALGLSRPQPSLIAQEFHRPFFEHLAWFLGNDHERIIDIYIRLYREVVAEKASLYPGIAETLQVLKERGYRLAIFSDKREAFGAAELEQAGAKTLLDHTLFLHDGRPYKPDPAGLQQVMKALGVTPEEALYVGDSPQDIDCSHRAGVRSVAALWGSVNREKVLARQPHYQLETVGEFVSILELSSGSSS